MITGFEEITADLSKHEMHLLPYVVTILSNINGKENAICNNRICDLINYEYRVYFTFDMINENFKLTGARLRKIIHHIRCTEQIKNLCSNSKGYYIGSENEVQDYIQGLKERLFAIAQIHRALKKQYRNTFTNQIKMEL